MDGKMMDEKLTYYEGLMDFLDDHVACLSDLISMYDEQLEGENQDGV